jgi:hypothetical protein
MMQHGCISTPKTINPREIYESRYSPSKLNHKLLLNCAASTLAITAKDKVNHWDQSYTITDPNDTFVQDALRDPSDSNSLLQIRDQNRQVSREKETVPITLQSFGNSVMFQQPPDDDTTHETHQHNLAEQLNLGHYISSLMSRPQSQPLHAI